MNEKGYFEITGTIKSREPAESRKGHQRIDLMVVDYFGRLHYIQARPEVNKQLAALNAKSATFVVCNYFSESKNGSKHNNLSLKAIK